MTKHSAEEKMFVKKMVSKITFFGIGAHLIYKFYSMSGLSKRICQLTGMDNCNEIERVNIGVNEETGECNPLPDIDEDVILTLTTKDCMFLKFKQSGNYIIDKDIKVANRYKGNKVLIDTVEMVSSEVELDAVVHKIVIQKLE